MSEFDRYDFAASMVVGAIAMATLALGAPLWVPVLIFASWITVGVLRHVDFDDMLPNESERPRRLIVLLRAVDGIRSFGSHLRPGWTRKEPTRRGTS